MAGGCVMVVYLQCRDPEVFTLVDGGGGVLTVLGWWGWWYWCW